MSKTPRNIGWLPWGFRFFTSEQGPDVKKGRFLGRVQPLFEYTTCIQNFRKVTMDKFKRVGRSTFFVALGHQSSTAEVSGCIYVYGYHAGFNSTNSPTLGWAKQTTDLVLKSTHHHHHHHHHRHWPWLTSMDKPCSGLAFSKWIPPGGNCRWHLAGASSLLSSSVRWIYLAYCYISIYTKRINCVYIYIWIFYCCAHCNCNQPGFEGFLHLLRIPKGEVGKGRYNFIHRIYIIYKQTVSKYINMHGRFINFSGCVIGTCHWHQESCQQHLFEFSLKKTARTQHFWGLSKTHQAPLDRPTR